MKHFLIVLMIGVLVLTGCGRPGTTDDASLPEKKEFYISTMSLENDMGTTSLKKSGKILGAQDIVVSSEVVARVENIAVGLGENVRNNQVVIELSDSSGSYSFAVQRAKASLDQARINYDQTMTNIDKSILDTQIALEQAKNQSENANLQQASTASLQLQQIDQQIQNAEYDYETKVESDRQTIDNFIVSSRKLLEDVKLLYQDVITETDQILGASNLYGDDNDPFEQLLGARNTATKQAALGDLRRLIQEQGRLDSMSSEFTEDNLDAKLDELLAFSEALTPFLSNVDTMLNFTDTNSRFGDAWLSGLRATINALQAQVQGTNSSIIAQKNTTKSFLRTYQNQQESLLNTIDTLRTQRRTQSESLTTAENNAGLSVETAQSSLDTTLKTKETTRASLLNAIDQAEISYNEALNQISKLQVESPIDGTIGDILVDVGQEISPGTPLFSISSIDEQQVEISLTSDELSFVSPGARVEIDTESGTFSGSILSITRTADATLTYKAIITVEGNTSLLGSVVSVFVPISSTHTLVPLKYVTIINEGKGLIYLYEGESIREEYVDLGTIRGTMIEVISPLPSKSTIITTDVSNFDPEKFVLSVQN